MKTLPVFQLLITFTILASCSGSKPGEMPPPPVPINYIVLLDLSDRLLAPSQAATDMALIQVVFDQFKLQVAQKGLFISSKDRLQIVVAPQEEINYDPAPYMDLLSLNLAVVSVGKKKTEVDQLELRLKPTLQRLYAAAIHGRSTPAHFAGSDLWRYFNEQLSSALVAGADNRLVVLTDGYLDFNAPTHAIRQENLYTTTNQLLPRLRQLPDWRSQIESGQWGLLPTHTKYDQLSVVVVEINPKVPDLREADMLKVLWQSWLQRMGVTRSHTIPHFNLSVSRTELDSFFE